MDEKATSDDRKEDSCGEFFPKTYQPDMCLRGIPLNGVLDLRLPPGSPDSIGRSSELGAQVVPTKWVRYFNAKFILNGALGAAT